MTFEHTLDDFGGGDDNGDLNPTVYVVIVVGVLVILMLGGL